MRKEVDSHGGNATILDRYIFEYMTELARAYARADDIFDEDGLLEVGVPDEKRSRR